jgi:hypothetical protein
LWSAVSTKKVDFIVEHLREYKAICKKALTHVSGAQIELFYEKTRGRKSRDRVPLRWGANTMRKKIIGSLAQREKKQWMGTNIKTHFSKSLLTWAEAIPKFL